MRTLYVFPHPDDESFGPAGVMARQRRRGEEVHLLTLTRGGATKVRHELGLDVEAMGEVRKEEMERMAEVIDLSSLVVLDLPDSGLHEVDPRRIEEVVRRRVSELTPDVLVTYPVHGISGFSDHLVTHAVVKRVFCELRGDGTGPRRLAFVTLEETPDDGRDISLTASSPEAVDCVIRLDEGDLDAQRGALDCYETYADVIARLDPMSVHGDRIAFELFQETHDPPLDGLGRDLPPA